MKKEKTVSVKLRLPLTLYNAMKDEAAQEYTTAQALMRKSLAEHVHARQIDMAILAEREQLAKKGKRNP